MPLPSIGNTRAYGYFVNPDTTGCVGSLSLTSTSIITDQTDQLFAIPTTFQDTLYSNGLFEMLIPSTDDPDWKTPNWKYTVVENVPYGRTYDITLPYVALPGVSYLANTTTFIPCVLTTTTITGTYIDFNGDPMTGTLTFQITQNITNSNKSRIVVPAPVVATLDANGSFTVTLYATDTLPTGLVYNVTENFPNGRSYNINLRSSLGATLNMNSIIPGYPSPTSVFVPVWKSLMDDEDERITTLEPQYADYAANVPTRSSAITNDANTVSTTNTATYATLSPIIDERLMPFLLNGAANAS